MDVHQGVAERFGQPGLLDYLTKALTGARNTAVPVIFVRLPEASPGQPQLQRHRWPTHTGQDRLRAYRGRELEVTG
jgi:hypothetical protein